MALLLDALFIVAFNLPWLLLYGIGLFLAKRPGTIMGLYAVGTVLLAIQSFGWISGGLRDQEFYFTALEIAAHIAAAIFVILFYVLLRRRAARIQRHVTPAIPNVQADKADFAATAPQSTIRKERRRFGAVHILSGLCAILAIALAAVSWSYHSYMTEAETAAAESRQQIAYWKSLAQEYKSNAERKTEELEKDRVDEILEKYGVERSIW